MKKAAALLLAFVLLTLCTAAAPAETTKETVDITLYIGAPLVLSGDTPKPLDSQNPGVVPIERDNRTLVPLRAVAEHFGADVSYEEDTQTAVIRHDGTDYQFPIGQKHFVEDGDMVYSLDVRIMLWEGRAMVPLRAIAEQVFGLTVSYYDRIIVIGDKAIDLKADEALCESIREQIAGAVRPADEQELRAALQTAYRGSSGGSGMATDVKALAEMPLASGAAAEMESANTAADAVFDASSSDAATGADYSTTNVQVEGIDEGDVLKTDGQYLYYLHGQRIDIIRADGGEMTLVSSITPEDDVTPDQLYIDGGRMVVLGTHYVPSASFRGWNRSTNSVRADVYDISDRTNPRFVRSVEAEGSLRAARKNGSFIYLIAERYTYFSPEERPYEELVPCVKDTAVYEALQPVALEHIMICPGQYANGYATIAAFDLTDDETPAAVESFLGSWDTVYMNGGALYLSGRTYSGAGSSTAVIKLTVQGTSMGFAAEGRVNGTLLNQFSMDEHDGFFRVATTSYDPQTYEQINNLYVLDGLLNVTGKVEGLAPGEQIYAVRFTGDTGYVVTFETMDPLFVLDLSDPSNPMVTGELKIPGFSNYLHPIDKNTVLGIGRDTQELFARDSTGRETVVGVQTGGIKLSLFDVSDPAAPVEKAVLTFGANSSAYADVLSDHRALMVDKNNSIVGFTLREGYGSEDFDGAVLVQASRDSLSVYGKLEAAPADYSYYASDRLCYIGSTLYYLQNSGIRAYDYQSLKHLAEIRL